MGMGYPINEGNTWDLIGLGFIPIRCPNDLTVMCASTDGKTIGLYCPHCEFSISPEEMLKHGQVRGLDQGGNSVN
jgi:hypothetical protein